MLTAEEALQNREANCDYCIYHGPGILGCPVILEHVWEKYENNEKEWCNQ
jgi:hypothetical protein